MPTGGAPGGGLGGGGGIAAFLRGGQTPRVPTGTYSARLSKRTGPTVTPIGPAQTFSVLPLLQP